MSILKILPIHYNKKAETPCIRSNTKATITILLESFLCNIENKRQQLTHLIIDYILSEVNPIPRKLYITKDFKCFLKSENITEIAELSSNHNEADPRIALPAVFATLTYSTMPIYEVSDDIERNHLSQYYMLHYYML